MTVGARSSPPAPERLQIDVHLAEDTDRSLASDVRDGLTQPVKQLLPKHNYDTRGAQLFDRICELPEYYQTRTELAILRAEADSIAARTGAAELVELGSGTAAKTEALLDAISAAGRLRRYVPFDVTEQMVRDSAARLLDEYPELTVHGVVGDFERHLANVPEALGPRIVLFLGGTIGNLTPADRGGFLRDLAGLLGRRDHLLLGTDLVKDPARIEAAYNDSQGVTAEFNRNILHVVNRELHADFVPDAFEHVAFYDRDHAWVDIRLRAPLATSAHIAALNLDVSLAAGEEIHTEISAKFTRERVAGELAAAGLELAHWYTDPEQLFAVSLSRPAGG